MSWRSDEQRQAYEAWRAERGGVLADLRRRTVPTHTDLRVLARDGLGLVTSKSQLFQDLRAQALAYGDDWLPSHGAARVVLREIAQTMAPSNTWGDDQTDV